MNKGESRSVNLVNTKVIKRLLDLYSIQGKRYIIQKTDGTYGQSQGNKYLSDKMLQDHLDGKYTVGTFSGVAYSKFICFDVDFHDKTMAKWITYKISNELNNCGIFDYYISFSGNKGYHIDIFIEDLITLDAAKKFFNIICEKAEVKDYGGQVEFRATDKLGVKLPLGKHQKTGNFCGYCEINNQLKVMSRNESFNYIFQINKIKRSQILNIIEKLTDIEVAYSKIPNKRDIITTEETVSEHKDLEIYSKSEDDNIDEAIELLNDGMKYKGSRHISIFKIAKYLKYNGLDESDTLDILNDWIDKQDPSLYDTPLDECNSENKRIVKWIYENDVSFTPKQKDIAITYNEINAIIFNCPEKNQKLITYAMLVHSKRYAAMNGVFYMTYEQIHEATGISERTAMRQIDKLEELNVIQVVERNRKQKGTYKKSPNKYKITLHINNNEHNNTYTTNKQNDFAECIKNYYSDEELKGMLPRRQYEQLVKDGN